MKTLRDFCAVLVLTLTLTLPAFAGQMDTMFVPPPPQQPVTQAATAGEMDTGIADNISTDLTATTPEIALLSALLNLILLP